MNTRPIVSRQLTIGLVSTVCALSRAGGSFAQAPAPTTSVTAPATSPTTAPRPRYQVTVPAGFITVKLDHRTVLCERADEAWVRDRLGSIDAPKPPTTMPADILQRLGERRPMLTARIAADLALKDPGEIERFFTGTLVPQLERLRDLRPPMFYLVCSRNRLLEIVKGGWNDPRFYYNRAANDVAYDPDLRLNAEGETDDMVMPVAYPEGATEDVKRKDLASVIERAESTVVTAVSRRAIVLTQLSLIDFIDRQAIAPLKLSQDQTWFGLGIEAVLSARYATELVGTNAEEVIGRMSMDDPRNPVRSATIDLLHPADARTLKREWMAAYNDAFRVRAAQVVHQWLQKAGDGAVAMTLVAFRTSPPADGAALVKMIHMTTGVDLSGAVKPSNR